MWYNLLDVVSVFKTVGYVVAAVFILLAMITIHEFGHYIVGKLLRFKINEFAIGMGPAIFKRKSKKTGEQFSLRVLPLGGYCAFAGEDDEKESSDPGAFHNRAPWRRILVLVAGALMNYILALLIIVIVFFAYGQMLLVTKNVEPTAEYTAEYCLQDMDVILQAEGKNIYLTSDLAQVLQGKKQGEKAAFRLSRVTEAGNREVVDVQIAMRSDVDIQSVTELSAVWDALGIAQKPNDSGEMIYQIYSASCKFGFFQTIGRAFAYSGRIAGSVFTVLGELLTGRLGLNAMGGPISTIKLTSQIAAAGLHPYLEIAAYIGVNLAVFNLLPIPALDGSKVVFTVIEWIRGKPINRKVENWIHFIGFILLFGFAILVDVLQFI